MLIQGGTTVSQDQFCLSQHANLGEQRVLDICCNPGEDELHFDVKMIAQLAKQVNPTDSVMHP